MTMETTVSQFLDALRTTAGDDEEARELVAWVTEHGREASLIRAVSTLPPRSQILSREEFERRSQETRAKVDALGIGTFATYEEYVATHEQLLEHRGAIPHFRTVVPDDFPPDALGLIPVPPDAQAYWLHGGNLAAYGTHAEVGDDGRATTRLRYLTFATTPCTLRWLGLAGMQAALATQRNFALDAGAVDPADIQDIVRGLTTGRRAPLNDTRVRWQLDGYRLAGRLFNRQTKGEFAAAVDTFSIATAADPIATMRSCLVFLEQELPRWSPEPPRSQLEEFARQYLLLHFATGRALPQDALIPLYARATTIAPPPHIDQ